MTSGRSADQLKLERGTGWRQFIVIDRETFAQRSPSFVPAIPNLRKAFLRFQSPELREAF
jgi:hypothetical protein